MDETIHLLMRFGLTHQEAKLYAALYGAGTITGYELAKLTGISRSNAYSGLSSLADKGGAWLVDGKPVRYRAAPVAEFCGNVVRGLADARAILEQQLTAATGDEDEYLTIKGAKNIRDKIETMIETTKRHIYLSMPSGVLEPFLPGLAILVKAGRKVVVITGRKVLLPGATLYRNPEQSGAIRVISDTSSALTGSLPDEPGASCLFSRKRNLVCLLRDSMANEIKLIKISGTGGETEEMELFYTDGQNPDFALLCGMLDRDIDEIVGAKCRKQYDQYNQRDNIHDVFIVYVNSIPAGCASLRHYDDEAAEVKRVFVRKEFRRQGIAEKLMKAVEDKAWEKGYSSLLLETGMPLAASVALYRKLGFEIIPNYGQYVGMDSSVCMRKERK